MVQYEAHGGEFFISVNTVAKVRTWVHIKVKNTHFFQSSINCISKDTYVSYKIEITGFLENLHVKIGSHFYIKSEKFIINMTF